MHPMWGVWGIGMMLVCWAVVIAGIVLPIRWLVSLDEALRIYHTEPTQ